MQTVVACMVAAVKHTGYDHASSDIRIDTLKTANSQSYQSTSYLVELQHLCHISGFVPSAIMVYAVAACAVTSLIY
jgi:hypothetical protein